MESYTSFSEIAKKPIRLITILYALAKVLFYWFFGNPSVSERAVAGVIMVAAIYLLTSYKKLGSQHLSILIPMSLTIVELTFLSIFGGDSTAYHFLIAIPLSSLLYLNIKGLFIVMILNVTITSILIFGLNVRLLGETVLGHPSTLVNEINNFAGVVFLYILLFLLARFSIRAIIETQRAAEAATRSKSQFLATMSHELRTPLNAIIGISQIQLQKENLPSGYAGDVEKIYNSGNNLLGIINDLLDMSKIESGKLQINPVEYDIADLINDTVNLNVVRIGSKQIEFYLDIEADLPSKVFGDELRIKQILNNLLSNAIKYTESGHVKLNVRHAYDEDLLVLTFIIEDSGQGIKPEDMERMFKEYVRFNSESNRNTEGTGLGLVITKRLIEMMDGTIIAKSIYGKGSKFTVSIKQAPIKCLPIGEETANQLCGFTYAGSKAQSIKNQIAHIPASHGKVLVVDDVETNLYVAQGMLDLFDIEMEVSLNGFQAIERIKKGETFDIIFMDHLMPGMDGIEATRTIREIGYTGIIIALTANALVGCAEMFMDNGFDDFISKPMDVTRLGIILNKWLRS